MESKYKNFTKMKSNIKILGMFIAFMFIFSLTEAQKCKYDYEKTDEFTGEISKGLTIKITNWLYIGINKAGDNYYLGASIVINGELNYYVEKGDSLLIKLSNGEMMTLYSKERSAPVSQVVQSFYTASVVTRFDIRYDLSEEQLQILSKYDVTYLRIFAGSNQYDDETFPKTAAKIKNGAVCILQ
jgi:hypothetical protein